MIDLAPSTKRGLTLKAPVMLAAGFAGYSNEYAELVDLGGIGALVTVPTTLHARTHTREPRVMESPAGFLLARGGTNPGLARVLQEHARAWKQVDLPIIFSLAAEGVSEWGEVARRLDQVSAVAGVELEITEDMDARAAIHPVRQMSDLPILVKIPIARADEFASECVDAGVNALVIGLPPRADSQHDGRVWKGRWFGAGVKPLALRAVRKVKDLQLEIPLVACGGIHSLADAHEFFAVGATAIQLDSVLWFDPKQANEIITVLANQSAL